MTGGYTLILLNQRFENSHKTGTNDNYDHFLFQSFPKIGKTK